MITSTRFGFSVFKLFSVKGPQRKHSFSIKHQGLEGLSLSSLVPSCTKSLRLKRGEDIAKGHAVPGEQAGLCPAQGSSMRQVPVGLMCGSLFPPSSHIRFFPSKLGIIKSTDAR